MRATIPDNLLDHAVAAVMIDRQSVEHAAVTLSTLMLLRTDESIPPLREIEEAIAEAVASTREGIAETLYEAAAFYRSRGCYR